MKTKNKSTVSFGVIPIFMICLLVVVLSGYPIQDVNKKEILKHQYRIKKLLHHTTKQKTEEAIQTFENQVASSEEEIVYDQIASTIIDNQFENLSSSQREILVFYILCQATNNVEEDIRMITAEIEAMNQAKEKLGKFIEDVTKWIEEETKKSGQESEISTSQAQEKEQAPLLKKHEDLEATLHFKVKYPRMPEIAYPENLEEMSLPKLRIELDRLKIALNSLHEVSRTGIQAFQKATGLRSKFLQTLSYLSGRIADIEDSLIKNIR